MGMVDALRDELWLRTLCTFVLRHANPGAMDTRNPLRLKKLSRHRVPATFPRLRVASVVIDVPPKAASRRV